MADGSTALVDETYLKNFILNPQARVVKGFAPIMPKIELSEAELAAVLACSDKRYLPERYATADRSQMLQTFGLLKQRLRMD